MYYFAVAQQTSTAKLAAIFQQFQKTVRSPRANESKVTSRNAFIDNIFALENEKISKKDKRNLF